MRMQSRTLIVALFAVLAAGLLATAARAATPSNTSPPTISGTTQQGKTLTANDGTWSNSPTTFFYHWQRCTADGTSCGNIGGNATHKTYTLIAADVDHALRVVVTASNADGQASANSKTTDVISANTAPKNTAQPTVAGVAQSGEELTADPGTWTGGVRNFDYQWQRCDSSGAGCVDASGASGRAYGVRAGDVGHTLRVMVKATNLAGSTTAVSNATAVVRGTPTTTTTTTTTTPPPAGNHKPSIRVLSVRFTGARVYVGFRVCDDSGRRVTVIERDSKAGVFSSARQFRISVPAGSCTTATRHWTVSSKFRHGRYKTTMWARDYAGLMSRPSSRSIIAA